MCIDMRNVAQQSHELIESFEGKLRYHFRRYGTSLTPSPLQRCVQLCLSAKRYADTLLLAIKGRDQLLQCTQKAYFERQTNEHPYLRLFQRIVTNDLDDVVQNADLTEWEFGGLAEQLGARLGFQAGVLRAESRDGSEDNIADALELRRIATLTYLAAGRLERLANIWIEELAEEEGRLILFSAPISTTLLWNNINALRWALQYPLACRTTPLTIRIDLLSSRMVVSDAVSPVVAPGTVRENDTLPITNEREVPRISIPSDAASPVVAPGSSLLGPRETYENGNQLSQTNGNFRRRRRACSRPALHAFDQPRIGTLLFLKTHPTTRFEGLYGIPYFLTRRAGRGNGSAVLPVNRDQFGERFHEAKGDDEQRMTVPVLGCEQKYRFLRASTSIRNTFRGLGCRHGGQESIWCGKYISSIVPPYAIPILFGLVL
ncbi:hypothetical protein V8E55_006782 [Tylopilus felleus]